MPNIRRCWSRRSWRPRTAPSSSITASIIPASSRAIITNLKSDKRPIGASTITQQVAKNLLVGNEVSYVRKAREAMLAYKIENALTKQQILELYLNQIELGRNAAGVEAAAHAYFDKELDELTLPQLAYLAILPKGPSNYDPERNYDRAMGRRNWVLGEMLQNGFITQASMTARSPQPLGTVRAPDAQVRARRRLFRRGGAPPADRPLRRDRQGRAIQRLCRRAVGAHVVRPQAAGICAGCAARGADALRPRARLVGADQAHASDGRGRWLQALLNTNIGLDYADWRAAIVVSQRAMPPPRSGLPTARPARCRAGPRRCRCAGSAAPRSRAEGRRHHRGRAGGRRVRAAQRPQGVGRVRRRGTVDRAHPGDAGRVRQPARQLQPRHAGAAPARIDDQADRLFGGAGERA